MAEQELQKPAAAPSSPDPVIHVIPEKFYGAALKQKAGKLPPPPPPPTTPVAAAPVPPPVPGVPAKKKRSMLAPILVVLVVLLLGGGTAAFFLLSKKPAPAANVPVVPVPTGPICGDGTCDDAESAAICAADCKEIVNAPSCGDGKCDAAETTASCVADCPAPAAVCGDAKCDATESVAACPSDCRPPEPVPGADSDSDGLTDEEERSVYGTDPNDPNTDKDKYVDLNEVLSLFDPSKPDPALLADNPGIATFTENTLGFTVLRPAGWTSRTDAEAKKVVFSSQGGESVELAVRAKTGTESLSEWFRAAFPENVSAAEPYRTRQGYEAIATADRQTIYVDGGDKVFSVAYILGDRLEIQYKVTFQMIVQSFRLLGR